jgi:hypothetical protein
MQSIILWITAAVGFLTFLIHTFIGGPRVAGPLLKDTTLPKASKWLNYYCWHITTIYTFLLGFVYAYVALNPSKNELIVYLSIQNTLLCALSVAVAIKGNINPFRFPSTSLFASLSILGFLSLLVK